MPPRIWGRFSSRPASPAWPASPRDSPQATRSSPPTRSRPPRCARSSRRRSRWACCGKPTGSSPAPPGTPARQRPPSARHREPPPVLHRRHPVPTQLHPHPAQPDPLPVTPCPGRSSPDRPGRRRADVSAPRRRPPARRHRGPGTGRRDRGLPGAQPSRCRRRDAEPARSFRRAHDRPHLRRPAPAPAHPPHPTAGDSEPIRKPSDPPRTLSVGPSDSAGSV
jgi:hypothetical protein